MPSARASRRGAFLNCRFAVNGIQKADCSRSLLNSTRLFMGETLHCGREEKGMRQRRKRSAAITLLLAGTMSGCGEPVPQQDVYRSLADCQRDWGDPQQCQPVRDSRYAQSYYYGPSYYGSSYPDG